MNEEQDEIQELGVASVETQGMLAGACYEASVLPYKLAPVTGPCTKP